VRRKTLGERQADIMKADGWLQNSEGYSGSRGREDEESDKISFKCTTIHNNRKIKK
tara:strand:+ start:1543 stop:1710 length:168 start_codon:yes stop_codon:yes gene_type:complete